MINVPNDAVTVIAMVGGEAVFVGAMPLPESYQDGKKGLIILGGDALVAVMEKRKGEEIDRLKGELEKLRAETQPDAPSGLPDVPLGRSS